jgi:capsid protein
MVVALKEKYAEQKAQIQRLRNAVLAANANYLKAKYDAAQTVDETRRHWANADNLSAIAANSPQVRTLLRNRSRYEIANNSYAKGMVSTLANHCIGTGPRLQLSTGNQAEDRQVATMFADWAVCIGLAEKLRTLRKAKCQDGEAFGVLVTNPSLEHEVTLDIRAVEADCVSNPMLSTVTGINDIDGVILDNMGAVTQYNILPYHPGDQMRIIGANPLTYSPSQVFHWFTSDRPGQYRGVPEITPSLPLFAQLRRYTLAVLAAAETAADIAGTIESDAPAGEEDDVTPMDLLEVEKRMLLTMPKGWKVSQLKAEQPTTTYGEFKREIIKEIARCLNMPFNIAAGDSSDSNFASGRLDGQIYQVAIWVERDECEKVILRKILREWLREARLTGILPPGYASLRTMPLYQWHWDSLQLMDPTKEAQARDTALGNGSGSRRNMAAEDGYDLDEMDVQAAADYGVSLEEYRRAMFNKRFVSDIVEMQNVIQDSKKQQQQTEEPQQTGRRDASRN